jgi:uncharacterized membrane protein YhaH (DUF805 family)
LEERCNRSISNIPELRITRIPELLKNVAKEEWMQLEKELQILETASPELRRIRDGLRLISMGALFVNSPLFMVIAALCIGVALIFASWFMSVKRVADKSLNLVWQLGNYKLSPTPSS